MASSSFFPAHAGTKDLVEKYKGLIEREMSTEGELTVIEVFTSVEALVPLADNMLKHDTTTQESTRFTIKKDNVRGSFVSILRDLDAIDAGSEMVVSLTPHGATIAWSFCQAIVAFPQFLHITRHMTSLSSHLTADQAHSVTVPRSESSQRNKPFLQSVSSTSSGFQCGHSLGVARKFSSTNSAGLSESNWSREPEEQLHLHPALQSWQSSDLGLSAVDGDFSNRTTARQTVILIEQFAFHLFFMVTRIPYQVLGAQCNDLNHEYMTDGISNLSEVVAQYIDSSAVDLKLWPSSEVGGAANALKSSFEQIRKKVQRSLEEVRSGYVPASVGGASYGQIQREADQFSRDVRSHLQLREPHIIFIFDFHRKVAVLNSRWSAGFYKFGVGLNPMEARIFRNEAREFVVVTRSVPNIFTQLYLDAIQAARYHCSRFQLGQYNDCKEFGVQLTFVRFLSDHMKSNLSVPSDGNIQFIEFRVPQDEFYKGNLLQMYEAGLLRIEDLYDENTPSQERAGTLQEDGDLQKALKLSLQESRSRQPQSAGSLDLKQDMQISLVGSDGFNDHEIDLAISMSLAESMQTEKGNGSGQLTLSEETLSFSDQNSGVLETELQKQENGHQLGTPSQKESINSLVVQGEGDSTTSKQKVASKQKLQSRDSPMASSLSSSGYIPQDPCLHLYCHEFTVDGFIEVSFLRIDVVGRDKVGKTSLTRSLTGQHYISTLSSTQGVKAMDIAVSHLQDWKVSKEGEDLTQLCNHFIASNIAERLRSGRNLKGNHLSIISSEISSSNVQVDSVNSNNQETQTTTTLKQLEPTTKTSGSIETQETQECDFTEEFVKKLLSKVKPESPDEISDEVKQLIGQYHRGELSLKCQDRQILVSVFDYGGHTVYQPSHAPFLDGEALKLIVFDASTRLQDPCKHSSFIYKEVSELFWGMLHMTNWEVVEEWLSHAFITSQSSSMPGMCLVGTHKDQALKVSDCLLSEQSEYVRRMLDGKPYKDYILCRENGREFICVDNTLSGKGKETDLDEGVRVLKNVIEKRAVDRTEKVPVRWFQLAMVIRELRSKVQIVSFTDLIHLASQLNLFRGDADFDKAVAFLSRKGVVLHRPVVLFDTHQKSLVIDPQWMTEQFCKVLTIHWKNDINCRFWPDLADLQQKGILTLSFALYLLEGSEEMNQKILKLMESYDLICPFMLPAQRTSGGNASRQPMSSSVDSLPVPGLKAFFVPSLLCPSKQLLEKDYLQVGEKVTHLWFRLPKCRIPEQLATRLLAHLVNKYRYLPQLFYRAGVFNVVDGHRLHLVLKNGYLQLSMYIVDDKFDSHSASYCEKARNIVQSKVANTLRTDFPGLDKLQRGFLNEDQNFSVFYKVKKKRSGVFQLKSDDGKVMATPELFHLWFKDKKEADVTGDSDQFEASLRDDKVGHDCFQSTDSSKPNYLSVKDSVQHLLTQDRLKPLLTAVAVLLDDEEPWPEKPWPEKPWPEKPWPEKPWPDQPLCGSASAGSAVGQRKGNWRGLWECLVGESPPPIPCDSPFICLLKKWSEEYGDKAIIGSLIEGLSAIRRFDIANLLLLNLGRGNECYDEIKASGNFEVSGHNVAAGFMPSITVNNNYYC
ncbi:uncharacterized protein LOC134185072 isoform X2 [Corticium candelabrum]|uniref:uncharacterized protein LOC134185072 isoform X2 n=1 Tax=Corticium candelabrum TaxID=121492 RepID=UPI002E261C02|nr:uncharacterized protein LOC134185072 isoform X2 [Corticium candelabrum]